MLNNGATPQLLMSAMKKYYELLTATGTMLNYNVPGHVVSLSEFFKFSTYTRSSIAKNHKSPLTKVKSWFDECSTNDEDELLGKFVRVKKMKDNY